MRFKAAFLAFVSTAVLSGCASPPQADPSVVDASCAQQCSVNLTNCSSGFTLFPVVKQKQCNDSYDVCVKGCPSRQSGVRAILAPTSPPTASAADRLKALEELL